MFPFSPTYNAGGGGNITFMSAIASTLETITVPGARQANDMAVMVDVAMAATGTPPSSVVPAGWSALGSSVTAVIGGILGLRYTASYKVLAGSEGLTTGMNGAAKNNKMMFLLRPSIGGIWGTPGSVNAVAQNSTPSNQTVTVVPGVQIVIGMAYDAEAEGLTLGMSPSAFALQNNGQGLQTGYIIYPSGAVNNTVSSTTTAGALGSFYIPLSA